MAVVSFVERRPDTAAMLAGGCTRIYCDWRPISTLIFDYAG